MARISRTKLIQTLPDGESIVLIDEYDGSEIVLDSFEQISLVSFIKNQREIRGL